MTMCDNFLSDVENDYNMTIRPRPSPLKEIENYFKNTDFQEISQLILPEDIEAENQKLDDLQNLANEFSQQLQQLKIRIR